MAHPRGCSLLGVVVGLALFGFALGVALAGLAFMFLFVFVL